MSSTARTADPSIVWIVPQSDTVVVPGISDVERPVAEPVLAALDTAAGRGARMLSICTGAFVLAEAGLLAGKKATTHHDFHDRFAAQYPSVTLERGLRFVESGRNLATAGGLTSGIDLALRVVERYFGRETARRTAEYMEYQGKGWLPPTG